MALTAGLLTLFPHAQHHGATSRFDEPDAAAAYYERRRIPASRSVNTSLLYDRAYQQFDRLSRFASRSGRSVAVGSRTSAVLDTWTSLGPGNIGGRSRVVRYHPTRFNVIFAAGVSGGLWKSDDNGTTWRPIAAGLANYAINSLAIDPGSPDTMFAGTGEGYFREAQTPVRVHSRARSLAC